MKEIHFLSKNERRFFIKTASDIKEMPLEIIEKDYWVLKGFGMIGYEWITLSNQEYWKDKHNILGVIRR